MRPLLPALLLLFTCTGCISVVPDHRRVTYTVLDADTRQPVAGFEVRTFSMVPHLAQFGLSGRTDARGRVRLADASVVGLGPDFLVLTDVPGSSAIHAEKLGYRTTPGDKTLFVAPAPTLRVVIPADYVGPLDLRTAPPIPLPPPDGRDIALVLTPGAPVDLPRFVGPAYAAPRYVDSRGRDLARLPETDRRPDRAVRFVAFDAATAVTTVHVGTRRQFDLFVASLRAKPASGGKP